MFRALRHAVSPQKPMGRLSPSMAFTHRHLHTDGPSKAVRVVDLNCNTIAPESTTFPTLYNGLHYTVDIFDSLRWTLNDQRNMQEAIWNRDCFLPNRPAAALSGTPFAVLSDIASQMAVVLADGETPGLLAKNQLRAAVHARIVDVEGEAGLFEALLSQLKDFQAAPTNAKADVISNVAFWCQWLIRGYLFEGKLYDESYTAALIPQPLSTMAFAANAALGRHQIEFVYDDYTLKAAAFPTHRSYTDVDYTDPTDILEYIGEIQTPVGFCDMKGESPEHNFRHNHSLMEQQMRLAFEGGRAVLHPEASADDVVDGWQKIATAADRAHRAFNTMMANTPAASYPAIRLPIKGVRGACGNVYPPEGVFYEGCGNDTFSPASWHSSDLAAKHGVRGCYVDREFGQTGANSSMYKWLDVFTGVTQQRRAYSLSAAQREQMAAVVKGEADPGSMGQNPIDSMQRAFDLLTRPPLHLDELVRVSNAVADLNALDHKNDPRLADRWEAAAFERLRAAYFVASHRMVHGKYVLKMIYSTTPVGGQSRAEGTGGSTPPFLKTFFDQTFQPALGVADLIEQQGREGALRADQRQEITRMRRALQREHAAMVRVQSKGLALADAEKKEEASP